MENEIQSYSLHFHICIHQSEDLSHFIVPNNGSGFYYHPLSHSHIHLFKYLMRTDSSHYSSHWLVDKTKAFVLTMILYGLPPPEYNLRVKHLLDHDVTINGGRTCDMGVVHKMT